MEYLKISPLYRLIKLSINSINNYLNVINLLFVAQSCNCGVSFQITGTWLFGWKWKNWQKKRWGEDLQPIILLYLKNMFNWLFWKKWPVVELFPKFRGIWAYFTLRKPSFINLCNFFLSSSFLLLFFFYYLYIYPFHIYLNI